MGSWTTCLQMFKLPPKLPIRMRMEMESQNRPPRRPPNQTLEPPLPKSLPHRPRPMAKPMTMTCQSGPNYAYVDPTAEDTMVVQLILASRMGTRELESYEEDE